MSEEERLLFMIDLHLISILVYRPKSMACGIVFLEHTHELTTPKAISSFGLHNGPLLTPFSSPIYTACLNSVHRSWLRAHS